MRNIVDESFEEEKFMFGKPDAAALVCAVTFGKGTRHFATFREFTTFHVS
jgi:hypothetical protein